MSPKSDWLWDRNITLRKARAILNDPEDKHFLSLSALLLSRKNMAKEVFGDFLKPFDFLKKWPKIKRQMRKDSWNNPRIEFWQAIYEKLREKYERKGVDIPKEAVARRPRDEFCDLIGNKIKVIRRQKGLTQNALAKRLKVSQQMISRIESGKENISLLTLKGVVDSLGANLFLDISP